ncbi:hypothetical protein GC093_32140 [Paenibacillus sp. LMG 31456]|uniref:Solute-binding protein family 5 domain-containing protein n=1 Tax=Paenibacillus foliorum TaxID=2654974 RepID=A0A972H7J1_9BACL|nr:ABC transporter substrate-binding protein [Paenibacillus foliorum]NOU97846.1 hypothetical protein [Paenibacillus foliorum]
MKKMIFLLLTVVLFIFLSACNSSTDKPMTDSKAGNEPKSGGILKFAQSAEPTTLDPYIWSIINDRNGFIQIFNSLMEYDPKTLQPVPGIVKETKLSEDGLTYDLIIVSDVMFHNGKKMTSDDVKYSLDRAMAKEAARTSTLLKSIKEVKVVDDTHLKVILSNKDSLLLDAFVEVFVTPNDPSISHSNHPVGTGPFIFDKWNRNEKIVLKKNPNYWKKGLPYLDGMEIVTIPDAEVKLLQLINGQVDVIENVPISKVTETSKNPNLSVARIADELTTANYFMLMNDSKTPFNNVKFRQAINYALDRAKMKQALFGNFVVRSTSVPSSNPNFNPDTIKYDKDLNKAKQLLKESGYNNEKLELIYHKNDMMYDIVAQIADQSLKELGVNVELKGIEIAQWVEKVFNKKQFDLALTSSVPKPNTIDMLYHMYGKQNGGAIQWNNKEWYDKLLSVSQMSTEEGKKALMDLQKVVLEESPGIIVGGFVQSAGLSIKTHGFIPSPQAKMYFESVWKD